MEHKKSSKNGWLLNNWWLLKASYIRTWAEFETIRDVINGTKRSEDPNKRFQHNAKWYSLDSDGVVFRTTQRKNKAGQPEGPEVTLPVVYV